MRITDLTNGHGPEIEVEDDGFTVRLVPRRDGHPGWEIPRDAEVQGRRIEMLGRERRSALELRLRWLADRQTAWRLNRKTDRFEPTIRG